MDIWPYIRNLQPILRAIRRDHDRDMDHQTLLLWSLVINARPQSVVEIGVRNGNSTLILAHAANAVGATLLAIDRQPCERARARLAACGLSAAFCWDGSVATAARTRDASVGFLHLDGDHTEPGVRADLESWSPKISPGGILVAHDAERESVIGPLRDLGWSLTVLSAWPGVGILQRPLIHP